MDSGEYKVKLEVFEGPLDLLLYLIKRDEVDIYDIPIERITRSYLEFMDAFQVLDLDQKVISDLALRQISKAFVKEFKESLILWRHSDNISTRGSFISLSSFILYSRTYLTD